MLMKKFLLLVLSGAALFASGCSTLHKSDSAGIQGTWKGQEPARETQSACSLIASGNAFEFRRADSDEWYKGTFVLRQDANPRQFVGTIVACPAPQYNGTTFYGIYLLQDGKLTLTANEPGNAQVPTGFDAPGSRKFLLKKQ